MKFTNKVLYYLLFTELSPNQARCNTCLKVTKSGNGYTNQFHHLLKRHPDNQELAAAAFRKGNRFGVTLPDQRTCDGWNGARRAFDWVGRQYPAFEARLAADIVNYPALESGIIKIISGSCLTTREQEAYKAFKRPATNGTVEETSRSFLAPVFQKALEPRTSYIPLA
ncbi:hypothetical protein PC112_g5340 [Phytophthora cactorum]|nr:hypothetical protein PC112_g5340 [Phytophthora cactorum]